MAVVAARTMRANDADLALYIRQNLPIGWSYESLVALANALGYVDYGRAGGGKTVDFATNEVLTNMAAAATLLRASAASAKKVDLTEFTECRVVCIMGAVAATAAAKCVVKFKTTLGANDAAYAAIGATAVEALMDTADTAVTSAWVALVAGAKADVFVAISTVGGDGAVDPLVGNLEVQFR